MLKKIVLLLIFTLTLTAEYHAKIYKIAPKLKQKMIQGHSWHRGCPVAIEDLRYLRLTYKNFRQKERVGELIVHKNIAKEVTALMRKLYKSPTTTLAFQPYYLSKFSCITAIYCNASLDKITFLD